MKTLFMTWVLSLLLGIASASAQEAPRTKSITTKPEAAASINVAELKWGEAPPDLPRGAQLAVLHGDPTQKVPFTIRLKVPSGYKIPPHWHSQDEQLTILSGTFIMHMGDTMETPGHTLTAGAFHFLPGKAHHGAEARGETVIQIHGMGPFDIHYLNPADHPKAAASTPNE
jgi:mannose-6-phosphate isomerase-like protein (cupin superfamily)